jgi:hypothetical protein
MRTLIGLVAACSTLLAQDKKPAPPKVDPAKVDQAIRKGVEYLKGQLGKYGNLNKRRSEELILWTFTHAGVAETDPDFEKLFKTVTEGPLEWTYNVALQAMILEELDRVKYQGRIAQCAQFLVDNQCKNGQWSYGEPDLYAKDTPTGGASPKAVASGGGKAPKAGTSPGMRTKPKVVRHLAVKQMKTGPATGDNSNSQYAALGLRACHDAGIDLPVEGVQLAEKWWRDSTPSGGWDYHKGNDPYGSMTAGAVGALTIYLFIQGKPWMKDKEVVAGLDWMGKSFAVDKNPGGVEDGGGQNGWQYYWLYAVERGGIFFGTEEMGAHEWYVEGAKYLLGEQKPDGSWQSKGADHAIWDTCFAILFLRRATRPLTDVASVDLKSRK